MKKIRVRLDELLVSRKLVPSRTQAKACVMAGSVLVDGRVETKAGTLVPEEARLEVVAGCPYVSRGGLKLAAALEVFPILISGRVCLDVGASTGGFTDCLLQKGASKVYAVDVGYAQLHAKLRAELRVISFEETHARDLLPAMFDPKANLAVIDASFISLTQVLPWVLPCLAAPYEIVALIKPQFEVGAKLAPKGVVRDAKNRQLAVDKVRAALSGLPVVEAGLMECPVHGPKGNIESFIYLKSA